MDFLLAGRVDLDGGEDHFEFLDEDAFDFEELRLIFRAEFFRAREVDEMVELFPALEVVLHLLDE